MIETSVGADRATLAVLWTPTTRKRSTARERVVLRFSPALAPIKAAIFPLVKKDGLPEIARQIDDGLRGHFNVFYDEGGAIGRRYRRQDEAGTPFGVTVDGQTTEDQTVTVRDRDTLEQVRVAADRLVEHLAEKVKG